MNRIAQLDPLTETGPVTPLFEAVNSKLGLVPNLFRVLGNSPAALDGYLKFSAALTDGAFNAKLREGIALEQLLRPTSVATASARTLLSVAGSD